MHFKIEDKNIPLVRKQDEQLSGIDIFLLHCSFIDVPIESCGKASPMRVSLQATAPDILLILLRHGANSNPCDGGMSPVIALMDKLIEYDEGKSYPYQLVSCLKIIFLSISSIEMPFKVSKFPAKSAMKFL